MSNKWIIRVRPIVAVFLMIAFLGCGNGDDLLYSDNYGKVNLSLSDIPSGHPRIWLTSAKLSELRAKACYDDSGNVIGGCTPDSTWTTLKAEVDNHLDTDFYGNDGLNWSGSPDADSDRRAICAKYLANFAIAYQVTKNPVYARAAIEKTLQYWSTPWTGYTTDTWITFDNWYTVRFLVPPGALIFDWCYDRMTADERTRFIYQLDRWAHMILVDPQADWGWHDGSNNFWYGYMWALTSVGYALYGHHANAESYINYVKTTMIPEAMNHLNDEELMWPICTGWTWCHEYGRSKGGEWSEGNSYGTNNTESLTDSLFAIKSSEGVDFFNQTNFFEEYILHRIHTQLPGDGRIIVAGDGGSTNPDRAGERLAIRAILEKNPNSIVARYGQKWINDYSVLSDPKLFVNFVFYDKNLAPLDYTGIDREYFAEGLQIQTYRNSWADDALWLYMRFSPHHSDHTYDGQGGHFSIWKSEWLIKNHNGDTYDSTDAKHNVVYLPPDGDKPAYWGEPTVLNREITNDYIYYSGDATQVFQTNCSWRACNVTLNQRSLFYIKDNYLAVYDRVNTKNASDVKAWQVFFEGTPSYDATNDIASYYNGTSKVFVKTLLPQNSVYALATEGEDGRLRITNPISTNYNNFLNIIEVKDGNVSVSPISPLRSLTGNMVGSLINNKYAVLFSENLGQITSSEYDIVASGTVTHYVTNLRPSSTYILSLNGVDNSSFIASANGVLKFTTSGNYRVGIRLNGTVPPVDTTPPFRSNGQPTGSLPAGTTQTTMSLITDETATCRYSTSSGVSYSSMTSSFTTAGMISHSTSVNGLSGGSTYRFYVKCADPAGNFNADDYLITFSVESSPVDTTPPFRSNGQPVAVPSGVTSVTVSLDTNELATCRYSASPGITYASMTDYFSAAESTHHSFLETGLTSGTYNFYVRCADIAGNANTNDYLISFTVGYANYDEIPPSAIADLTVSSCDYDSCSLIWTAPGDDGNVGTADSYDMRYSTSVINASNFNSAAEASVSVSPKPADQSETVVIAGLAQSRTYYFAIKTSDEAGNVSVISNVVYGTTQTSASPPDDDINPQIADNNGVSVTGGCGNINTSAQMNFLMALLILFSSLAVICKRK